MKSKKWTKEEDKLLKKLWLAGKTSSEISCKIERTIKGIERRIFRLGIRRKKVCPISNNEINFIIKNRKNGLRWICSKLNRSTTCISRQIKLQGLPVRIYKQWSKEEDDLLRIVWNTAKTTEELVKHFEERTWRAISRRAIEILKIKTKDKMIRGRNGNLSPLLENSNLTYYWIGFLSADGYFNHKQNQLVICLHEKDKEHLQKFAKFIGSTVRIIPKNQVRVTVADEHNFPRIMKKFGFTERKTYNPPTKLLRIKNKELFYSFFAGFIDGDGSFVKTRGNSVSLGIECHSTWKIYLEMFAKQLSKLLENYKIRVRMSKRGYCTFRVGKKALLIELKKTIDSLNIPVLERKWSKINYV